MRRIAPLVAFPFEAPVDSLTRASLGKYAAHTLLFRVAAKRPGGADDESRFEGKNPRVLLKYAYGVGDRLSAGVVAEKDPGEPFRFDRRRKGFDYYAGYLLYRGRRHLEQLIVGSYGLQFGQGVTLWSGFALSSGMGAVSGRRTPMGIRRHSATEENHYLQGAAATLTLHGLKVTAFASFHWRDANEVGEDTVSGRHFFSGFKQGGYHRNAEEMAEKHNLGEYLAGGNLSFSRGRVRGGLTGYYQQLSGVIVPGVGPSTWYKFSGDRNGVLGADMTVALSKALLYGEGAVSASGGKSLVMGVDLFPATRLTYTLHFRHADASFHNHYARIYRLASGANQWGIYQGGTVYLGHGFSGSAFVDRSRRYSVRSGCHKPVAGGSSFGRLTYQYGKKVHAYLQVGYDWFEDDAGSLNGITWQMWEKRRWRGRVHAALQMTPFLRIQYRFVYLCGGGEEATREGFLAYLDLRLHQLPLPLTCSIRYTFYDTDGYDTRIYSYESDVLYHFSVPAYYGQGKSLYLYLSWKPLRWLTFYGRGSLVIHSKSECIEKGQRALEPAYSFQIRFSP